MEVSKKCKAEWAQIVELEEKPALTDEENERLEVLKHKVNLVQAAITRCVSSFPTGAGLPNQICKLVPYWGRSAQPGSTYYLQKLNHDILRIVNHSTDLSAVYLFDERTGPKNTDHTISYITHYLGNIPEWLHRIHLFLDNTCSTNKNYYLMAWAMELVQQGKVDFIRISFLIAGHTKFSTDLLFSKIAKTYNSRDVFTTSELQNDVIAEYADVTVDDGNLVYAWREAVAAKYSKFPGIRSLHDFIFTKNPATGSVLAKTRSLCYTGSFSNATYHPCFSWKKCN